MQQHKGFLLISVILAIAIIFAVITMRYKDNTGTSKNSLERGQSSIESANEAKLMLEQRNEIMMRE